MKYSWLNCKYWLISITLQLTIWVLPCKAQIVNLVPNPSFEDTLTNIGPSELPLQHWRNLDSNTNNNSFLWAYVHMSTTNGYTLPLNYHVYQYPRSGGGVLDVDGVFSLIPQNNKRSVVRTKLKAKLIAGKIYCVKIYAVYADNPSYSLADGLQLYFDNGGLDTMVTVHHDSIGIYPFVKPQVALAKGKVLTDTMNWNLIVGSFVANGTEEFLTIGNFKINDSVTRISIDPNALNPCSCTALLLDDVSVYPIDLANWLPPSYGCAIGDTATIGLPNYETPDAKWYTYNMVLIDSGSQIKVVPVANGTKYICCIDMCNTMVFDTVEVRWFPLSSGEWQMVSGELSVYPNPASDVIVVSNVVGSKVGLYNAVGQLVAEQKVVQNKATIQVAHLPKGVYVVKTVGQIAKVVIR
jgi:Secretion system C-terminal sorting domain